MLLIIAVIIVTVMVILIVMMVVLSDNLHRCIYVYTLHTILYYTILVEHK